MRKFQLAAGLTMVILAFTALVALRWHNSPSQPPLVLTGSTNGSTGTSWPRGSELTTQHGEYRAFSFPDGSEVSLDQDTIVRLDATLPENKLTLMQGRIMVGTGQIQVTARELKLDASACVLVHYSWLDAIDASPLRANGCAFAAGQPTIMAGMTTRFSTLSGNVLSVSNFLPSESSARPFFDWTRVTAAPLPGTVAE